MTESKLRSLHLTIAIRAEASAGGLARKWNPVDVPVSEVRRMLQALLV